MISFSNQELNDKPEIKAGDVIEYEGETVTVLASDGGTLSYVKLSDDRLFLVGVNGKDIR